MHDLTFSDDFYHIVKENSYLDGQIEEIIRQHAGGAVALDVGANIGLVSALLSRKFQRVFSFEPHQGNQQRLLKLLEMNGIGNVSLIPKGVSREKGSSKLFLGGKPGHHSLGLAHEHQQNHHQTQSIELTTLDDFCEEQAIQFVDFLKVDVEGFEIEVFQGAKNLFAQKAIGYLVFEVSSGVMKRLGRSVEEILKFLDSVNYELVHWKTKKPLQATTQTTYMDQDLVALPKK